MTFRNKDGDSGLDNSMPEAINPKLELFPTHELICALLARYDDAVFSGMIDRPDPREGQGERLISRRYKGDLVGCIGLVGLLQMNCTRMLDAQITEIDPNEI